MNRELKFRIWNNDEMLILDMVKNKYDFENGEVLAFVNDAYREFGAHEFYPNIKTDWVVMQYTGMKDKNGKDIYEGDIVMLVEANRLYTVEWLEYTFKLVRADPKLKRMHWGSIGRVNELIFTVEVVGNIFENRELIR